MSSFYSPYLRKLFTDRARELSLLGHVADELQEGRPTHVAIFGLRRIGKTLLAQEQVTRLQDQRVVAPVYMDMQAICSAPEPFAQRYIGLTCYWVLGKGEGPVEAYLTADRLLETEAATNPIVARTVGTLIRELGQRKPDYSLLVKLALDFPDKLARAVDQSIMCFLDEFPELASLSNFPGLGDPLKHFRASLQQQSRVAYVITGSAVTAMENLIRDHESPLFLQFRALELHPFTKEDTSRLVERLLPGLSPSVQSAIYTYTFGHPFYVTAVTERLRELVAHVSELGVDQVQQAFLLETLTRQGQIYGYCRYLYDISLQKARGYGLLKALLQILAEEEGLTLSEAARRLRRQASATREYLRWLTDVDLIIREDKRYYYRDPVLRFWVAYTGQGVEVDVFPRREDLEDLIAALAERFQRVSTQLGRAKESEIRELLRRLSGRQVPGQHFGQDKLVQVPRFVQVEPYLSPDGQIELDALAEGEEPWVVEVKWRLKRVGIGELKQLLEHAETFGARAWCISQAGFTHEASAFAKKSGVLISQADDLEALQRSV
ncbi:MAG: ATP-binding protein [Anaerolineae bacterium]